MKLYTEEEIRRAIAMGYDWCHQKHIPSDDMIDRFIQSLKTIELPSDEEIEKEFTSYNQIFTDRIVGAKWVINKIKGGEQ